MCKERYQQQGAYPGIHFHLVPFTAVVCDRKYVAFARKRIRAPWCIIVADSRVRDATLVQPAGRLFHKILQFVLIQKELAPFCQMFLEGTDISMEACNGFFDIMI